MKKAILIIMITAILFTACSNIGDNSTNISDTETSKAETTTIADSTTETTPETVIQSAAETTAAREFKGDMTIRTGIKLDTAEFDGISPLYFGPLIDGKVITFKNIGEPYLKMSYIEMLYGSVVELSFSEQEIGYINCKTGEKVSLCRIKPITSLNPYVYLDSTYAYIMYSKLPDRELPESLNEKDYDNLLAENNCTILRMNVKTNEFKEYDIITTGNEASANISILGKDSLLLHYYKRINDMTSEDHYEWEEYMDYVNLSTGELTNLYYGKHPSDEEIYLEFVSEDKAYFRYKKYIENECELGFRVYDTHMNLLNETKVSENQKNSENIELFVDNNDVYCRITILGSGDGNLTYCDYKFIPSGNSYISAGMSYHKMSEQSFWSYRFPRSNSDFPYSFMQSNDLSYLILSEPEQEERLKNTLKIDIEGFNKGWLQGYYSPMTDYNGDFLALSGTNQRDKFDYFYIPKEEIMRALYGE